MIYPDQVWTNLDCDQWFLIVTEVTTIVFSE